MTGARPKSEVLSEFRAGLQALLAATPRSVRARMRLNIHAGPPPPMTPGGGTVFGREPDEIIFLLRQPDPPASPERALLEKCGLASPGVFFCDASGRDMHMEKIFLALSAIRPDENMVCVSNGPGDEYKALAEQVRKAVVGMLSDIKFESNSRLMRARCAIHNMRPLLDGRARLARPAKEAPNAVVCGAGPSLADDIGTIKKYRESFVVVSVGRAARHLEAAGVSPDFLVEIDMDCDQNWDLSRDFDTPLACSSITSPDVVGKARIVLPHTEVSGASRDFLERIGVRLPEMFMSRSVIVSAVDFAARLGCRKIALAGCDLCFAKGGASHLGGGELDSNSGVFEVPAKDGGLVLSNIVFDGIRECLENYLARLNAEKPGTKVFNCARGGALIKNTANSTLEEFRVQNAPPAGKPSMEPFPSPEDLRGKISEAVAELEKFPGETGPLAAALMAPAAEHADEILLKANYMGPTPSDEEVDAERSRMLTDLARDYISDLRSLSLEPGASGASPRQFQSFRKFATAFIARSNPSLAEALREPAPGGDKPFKIVSNHQAAPYVRVPSVDGGWMDLNDRTSMDLEACRWVREFEESRAFSPERHGALFVFPGNWAHVAKFCAARPGAKIAVLEPWTGLLSEIIGRTMFAHRLPPDAVVIGADAPGADWRRSLHGVLRGWRREGREPVVFEHPRLADIPSLADFRRSVGELL